MALQLLNAGAPVHSNDVVLQEREHGILALTFFAMASPCEILVASSDRERAQRAGEAGAAEAWRIERRFSRYRDDSVVTRINRSDGHPTTVDAETAGLIEYAAGCYRLSEGLFDITSGVLRRVWKFDGSDRLPANAEVEALLPHVGFHRVIWHSPTITLPRGMELDLGGVGKEYAVDRALAAAVALIDAPVLVNFGGDLCANRAPESGPWRVAIERPDTDREARLLLDLTQGALATSGDTRRFLLRDGVRYGHILDPGTGWPVSGSPRSVTVAAGNCLHAGTLATFASLRGPGAEEFLRGQGMQFWCLRDH